MDSTAEHDRRVMSIMAGALRLPGPDREVYVRLACHTDPILYKEVAEAVEWEERMGDFLLQPLFDYNDLDKPFSAGDVVLDRFEIIREAGSGGMGIVYEAFDRKLNARVAIKCGKRGFRRLLCPELQGALKIRHRNICLVKEVHTATVKGCEVDFLTMEFLDGETLAARLRTHGPISPHAALPIARQLCAGLSEAHRVGVIHRDLKAANIFLTQDASGPRAVITDFGLASADSDGAELAGTPAYMAPELWRDEKASIASDVYALGVVLYEMLTARRPHDQAPVDDRLSKLPVPPSLLVANGKGAKPKRFAKLADMRSWRGQSQSRAAIPSCWDETILRCLDPSPARRPASALDVIQALEPPAPQYWRLAAYGASIVALVALTIGLITPIRERVLAFFKSPDVRLAILPPDAPPDTLVQANGVLQDVSERLKRLQRGRSTLVVIPATDAMRSNVHTPQDAKKILHATHALQLRLRRDGNRISVDESVIELATLTHLRDFDGAYEPAVVSDMPGALTGAVATALRLREGTHVEGVTPAAAAAYQQGLYLLRRDRYSFDDAIAKFTEAARLDPHSALPLAGLAEAQLRRFSMKKAPESLEAARAAIHQAEALNADSVAVRLASGLLNYTTGEYAKALEDYARVQDLEPRNIDVMFRIANVYGAQNQSQRAIESFRKAIALDPEYYAAYHEFGVFYYYRGDYPEALEQFQKTIQHAPGLYEAYTNLGAVLSDMGRDAEAEQALRSSLALHTTPRALNSIGAVLAYQGRDAEAVEYYRRATNMEPANYKYWLNLGDSARRLGHKDVGLGAYARGEELALAELQENPRSAMTRAFVAYLEARLGRAQRAEQEGEQALRLSPDDNQVIRCAVLLFEAIGNRDRTLQLLARARPGMLSELNRHPDLAELRRDSRFKQLLAKTANGG